MGNELPSPTWKDRLLFRIAILRGLKVEGNSMSPTLNDSDVVLYDPRAIVNEGDIVFVAHPFKQSVNILKRIAAIDANGDFVLKGDNPDESTDSRTFGPVSIKSIKGRVVCRWK